MRLILHRSLKIFALVNFLSIRREGIFITYFPTFFGIDEIKILLPDGSYVELTKSITEFSTFKTPKFVLVLKKLQDIYINIFTGSLSLH